METVTGTASMGHNYNEVFGGKHNVLRPRLSAIRSNCKRSSRHIFAAFTLAALSSFGSKDTLFVVNDNFNLTKHKVGYCSYQQQLNNFSCEKSINQ